MSPEQRNIIVTTVPCPHCQAAAGEPCRDARGRIPVGPLHLARRDAAHAAGVYTVR